MMWEILTANLLVEIEIYNYTLAQLSEHFRLAYLKLG